MAGGGLSLLAGYILVIDDRVDGEIFIGEPGDIDVAVATPFMGVLSK